MSFFVLLYPINHVFAFFGQFWSTFIEHHHILSSKDTVLSQPASNQSLFQLRQVEERKCRREARRESSQLCKLIFLLCADFCKEVQLACLSFFYPWIGCNYVNQQPTPSYISSRCFWTLIVVKSLTYQLKPKQWVFKGNLFDSAIKGLQEGFDSIKYWSFLALSRFPHDSICISRKDDNREESVCGKTGDSKSLEWSLQSWNLWNCRKRCHHSFYRWITSQQSLSSQRSTAVKTIPSCIQVFSCPKQLNRWPCH